MRKARGKIRCRLLIALFTLAALAICLRLLICFHGAALAARVATGLLGVETTVERLDISLFKGALVVEGAAMAQPEGFGGGEMFRLERLEAEFRPLSLLGGTLEVTRAEVRGPYARMVYNREGELNFDAAFSAPDAGGDSGSDGPAARFLLAAAEVEVSGGGFAWLDLSREIAAEPEADCRVLEVAGLDLRVRDARVDTELEIPITIREGRIRLSGIVFPQPPGFGSGDMLRVLALELELGSVAFAEKIEVRRLSLSEPDVCLAADDAGGLNISAAFAAAGGEEEPEEPGEKAPFHLLAEVGQTAISGGFLGLRDLASPSSGPGPRLEASVGVVAAEFRDSRIDLGAAFPVASGTGGLRLEGIRVAQPPGFGEGEMISVSLLEAEFVPPADKDLIEVARLSLRDPVLFMVNDHCDRLNLAAAFSRATDSGAPEIDPPALSPLRVLVRDMFMEGGDFRYRDYFPARPDNLPRPTKLPRPGPFLDLDFDDIRLAVSGFRLSADPAASPSPPARLEARASIRQKDFPAARLGLLGRLGPLGGGIPVVTSVFRLVSLELETLGDRIPDGTRQAVGGEVIDLGIDLALSPELLDLNLRVEADGSLPLFLHVGGTPSSPAVDTRSVLFGILTRSGGAVGNLFLGAGKAGYQVGATAVNTVGAVGKGVFGMVFSLFQGLGTAVAGAATGDMSKVGRGLHQTTVGTAGEAYGTVTATGRELMEGAVDTAGAAFHAGSADKWRQARDRRWKEAWPAAHQALESIPYPP